MPASRASAASAGRVAVPREDRAIGILGIARIVLPATPLRLTGPRAVRRKLLYSNTHISGMQVSWEFRRLARFLGYRLHTRSGSCHLARRLT